MRGKQTRTQVRLLVAATIGLCAAFAGPAQAVLPLYVANHDAASVSQYDAVFGALTPLSPAAVAVPPNPVDGLTEQPAGVAISPDGRAVFVTSDQAHEVEDEVARAHIYPYSVAPDGSLTPKAPVVIGAPRASQAFGAVVTVDSRYLYVVSDHVALVGYAIEPDATLSPLPQGPIEFGFGIATVGPVLTPDGRSLLVATDTGSGSLLRQFSIGADGKLTERPVDRPGEPFTASGLAVTPDGRYVYLGYAGGMNGWVVTADGTLDRVLAGGDGGLDLVASTDSRHLYRLGTDGDVRRYAIDADGYLTAHEVVAGPAGGRDIAVSADGRSLYVANATNGVVSQYAVANDGTISPRTPATVAAGAGATAIAAAVDPAFVAPGVVVTVPAQPEDPRLYDQDSVVHTDFSCFSGPGGPALTSCLDQDGRPAGAALDTSTPGARTITVTAVSSNGFSTSTTVRYSVGAVNHPPVANDQSVSTDEDVNLPVTLAATDADGDTLSYSVTQPARGSVGCSGRSCTYRPSPNFNGTDSFTFTARDPFGEFDTATVTVTVSPVQDAPVAQNSTVTVPEDSVGSAIGISAYDPDGDTLTSEVTDGPSHGTATLFSATGARYTPAADYNGTDAFSVTLTDTHGGTATATVSVTISPRNDAPIAQNLTLVTDEDASAEVALAGADVDGDALTYAITQGPGHGGVTCAGALCTYAPAAGYVGADSFSYRVTDPSGAGATATVSITVNRVAHPTTLTVAPVLRVLTQPLLKLTIPFKATLTRTSSGSPLAGKTVRFVTGGQTACTAVTASDGVAACSATVPALLGVLLGGGYTAVFDGDLGNAASSAQGALVA